MEKINRILSLIFLVLCVASLVAWFFTDSLEHWIAFWANLIIANIYVKE